MTDIQAAYAMYRQTGHVDDLLTAIKPIILSSIRGILKPHQRVDEDDLVQSILVEVWTKLATCTGDLKAWVRSITRSRCIDHVRRMKRFPENQPEAYEAEAASLGHTDTLPNNLTQREWDVADRLDNGDPVREIAATLGISRSSVQRSIESIRQKYVMGGTNLGAKAP